MLRILALSLVLVSSVTAYAADPAKQQTTTTKTTTTTTQAPASSDGKSYTCGTKTKCSEMKSCEEATYFYKTCGLTKLDADKDGVPCESLCKKK
jgi:hypothetical protein